MARTVEQMRHWQGPALLSYGFRPFFLGAALWAVIAMLLWVPMMTGGLTLPTAFDPVSWHAHAFLFGYLLAVVAGFLLTAVPNWTGRLPIVGWPLALLFALWIAGRAAVALSSYLPPFATALIDLAMPLALTAVIAREIIAGRNWRNLMVLGMLVLIMIGDAVFHWEAASGAYPAKGYGLRIGLGAGILMISVIGGRVVPSFTRNWLAKQNATTLPVPPMQRFDKIALLGMLVALTGWVAMPDARWVAALLAVAGVLHILRLARWAGRWTLAEPLIAVLHVAYAFVPLGAMALALEILIPGTAGLGAVQHVWMAGAIGLMTLAIMTRATLGHTGQPLTATGGTVMIYGALILAVVLRVSAGVWPGLAVPFYWAAAVLWITAFLGFAIYYGRLLLLSRSAASE